MYEEMLKKFLESKNCNRRQKSLDGPDAFASIRGHASACGVGMWPNGMATVFGTVGSRFES